MPPQAAIGGRRLRRAQTLPGGILDHWLAEHADCEPQYPSEWAHKPLPMTSDDIWGIVRPKARPHPPSMDRSRAKIRSRPTSPLQSAYRRALSAAVVAHANYLAVQGDKSATPHRREQCKVTWQSMEARKSRLLARLNATTPRCADDMAPSAESQGQDLLSHTCLSGVSKN